MRISEVAKMLNISIDSIRFYEKEGVLSPVRKGDGKYREYSPWDIFTLIRCARFRGLGLSVRETVKAMHHESLPYILEHIEHRQDVLARQMQMDVLLHTYLNEFKQKLQVLPYNIGNFWVSMRPKLYYILDAQRIGNVYDMSHYNPLIPKWMKHMPFISEMEFVSAERILGNDIADFDEWGFSIDESLAQALRIEMNQTVQILEETLCICTVLDAGELGAFSLDMIKETATLLTRKGYSLHGMVTANLIIRNWEKDKYHRYFEVTYPIKSKENF